MLRLGRNELRKNTSCSDITKKHYVSRRNVR